jgi:hypothetical protein
MQKKSDLQQVVYNYGVFATPGNRGVELQAKKEKGRPVS